MYDIIHTGNYNMEREQLFNKLLEELYGASKEMHERDKIPHKYGTNDLLYMSEAHTLKIISNNENMSITEIAKATAITKSAVSQTIEKLLEKGLITKSKDELDNRRIKLLLTDKGRIVNNYHKDFDKKKAETLLKKVDVFTNIELETTIKVLKSLKENWSSIKSGSLSNVGVNLVEE